MMGTNIHPLGDDAHVADLQAAVAERMVNWVAFPDRPEAHAVGVQQGYGYLLQVKRMGTTRYWNWVAHTGPGAATAGVTSDPVAALNAADAEYARAAAEYHAGSAA